MNMHIERQRQRQRKLFQTSHHSPLLFSSSVLYLPTPGNQRQLALIRVERALFRMGGGVFIFDSHNHSSLVLNRWKFQMNET